MWEHNFKNLIMKKQTNGNYLALNWADINELEELIQQERHKFHSDYQQAKLDGEEEIIEWMREHNVYNPDNIK